MNLTKKKLALLTCMGITMGTATIATAGNRDRAAQSGAMELLINPWGQTGGTFGANTAFVHGMEAMKGNIGGLAFTKGTEVGVAYSRYLSGYGVSVNNLGFAQNLGGGGVLGVNVMSMGFGDIPITTYDQPGGGTGVYRPQFLNFQVGYAREFSNSIHAGVAFTYVSEQISTIRASGACFDAGVQYQTGKRDNFHFGITLRNVGTNMRFSGSGFSFNTPLPENEDQPFNANVPSQQFQMPTYLNISASYDFFLDENRMKNADDKPRHRLSAIAGFTSNSYNNDYIHGGLEYGFREMFMLRAGYRYERDITDKENTTTFYTGIAAGATIMTTIGKGGPHLALDYSYKPTYQPNNGVHTFSIRFMTNGKKAKAAGDGDDNTEPGDSPAAN